MRETHRSIASVRRCFVTSVCNELYAVTDMDLSNSQISAMILESLTSAFEATVDAFKHSNITAPVTIKEV